MLTKSIFRCYFSRTEKLIFDMEIYCITICKRNSCNNPFPRKRMARTKRLPARSFQVSYQDLDHIFCCKKRSKKTLTKLLKMFKIKKRKNVEKNVGALMEYYDSHRSFIPTYEELEREIGIDLSEHYSHRTIPLH